MAFRQMTIAVRGFPLRGRPDDDVFERALASDPVAFAEVYRRYRSRIYGFCLSLLLSPTSAEDATQEVFLRAMDAHPGHVEHPRAWLFGIARNVCADAVRKKMNAAAEEPLDGDQESVAVACDSADEAMAREAARNVFLALRRLNPRYRTALILRDIHGEPSASIAEALGTTTGAADTLACRARDSFGRMYAAVSGMPPSCRDAVTLAYRATGSGISNAERARLDAHLRECASCRRESERANDAHGLAGLLPLLASAGPGRRVFVEALSVLPTAARMAEQTPALVPTLPHLAGSVAAVCATAALLLTTGAVPAREPIAEARRAVSWRTTTAPSLASCLPAGAVHVAKAARLRDAARARKGGSTGFSGTAESGGAGGTRYVGGTGTVGGAGAVDTPEYGGAGSGRTDSPSGGSGAAGTGGTSGPAGAGGGIGSGGGIGAGVPAAVGGGGSGPIADERESPSDAGASGRR